MTVTATASQPAARARHHHHRQAAGNGAAPKAPARHRLHQRDTFEAAPRTPQRTDDPKLDRIANATLRSGQSHSCVTTVRNNLDRLGFGGLPAGTGSDANNPRGMMVQMLQSGQWRSANIPGAQAQRITSPYGTVQANVLSRDAFHAAAAAGQIPNGAVVFQTRHGWDYSGGSLGNDVGIVQNGRLFNSRQMQGLDAYGARSGDFVVVRPN